VDQGMKMSLEAGIAVFNFYCFSRFYVESKRKFTTNTYV